MPLIWEPGDELLPLLTVDEVERVTYAVPRGSVVFSDESKCHRIPFSVFVRTVVEAKHEEFAFSNAEAFAKLFVVPHFGPSDVIATHDGEGYVYAMRLMLTEIPHEIDLFYGTNIDSWIGGQFLWLFSHNHSAMAFHDAHTNAALVQNHLKPVEPPALTFHKDGSIEPAVMRPRAAQIKGARVADAAVDLDSLARLYFLMQSVSRFSWRDSKLVTERHIRATRLQIEKNKTHRRVLTSDARTLSAYRAKSVLCQAQKLAKRTPADERAPTSNITFFGASSDALPVELQNLILEKAVDAALADCHSNVDVLSMRLVNRQFLEATSAIATRKIEAHKETLCDFLLKGFGGNDVVKSTYNLFGCSPYTLLFDDACFHANRQSTLSSFLRKKTLSLGDSGVTSARATSATRDLVRPMASALASPKSPLLCASAKKWQ